MSELVPFDFNELPSVELASENQLGELVKATDYLQRIQLITKGRYVDQGLIAPGHYGVPAAGGETITDLGPEIDILPFCVRPKALDMRDRDAIIAVYDMADPKFEELKQLAREPNSNIMWGPSYLVFERATGSFYELFMGNKSARSEAGKLTPFLPVSAKQAEARGVEPHGPLPATMKVRYAQRKSYGWHVPVIVKCSTPFTNLPPMDKIREEMERFAKAKDDGVQVVDEDEAPKRRAR